MLPFAERWLCFKVHHSVAATFSHFPKMGAVSWGRWRGNGPKTYLLSHNPINNEAALTSWWTFPLTLLRDESFLMLRVHLWPFSVLHFFLSVLENVQYCYCVFWKRISSMFHQEWNAGFHSSEELQTLTSLIKTHSITKTALIREISRCSVGLERKLQYFRRELFTKMDLSCLFIEQIKPQRKNGIGKKKS